jgi:methionyl-tRNA formyltransferase
VRAAFYGTSPFGAAVLRRLVERGVVEIAVVVSQPDRPSGRGRRMAAPAVAQAASELGIELRQPGRASDEPPAADAGIVVAFGQLLREPLISAMPLVNLHPSLLPRWRGAAPVERAIIAGDAETGVAAMAIVEELDAGPLYGVERWPIGPHDDAGAVRERAVELGAPLLERALLDGGDPVPQAAEGVTYAAKLTAADRVLDLARPAAELDRVVRGLSPHIGARMDLDGRPLTVWKALPLPDGPPLGEVGPGLVVGCGDGGLQLQEVQPAGKRRMAADEFLRGLREPPRHAS